MTGTHWSKEEERKLTDMLAAGMSPETIAKELGRSILAVKCKAKRMRRDDDAEGPPLASSLTDKLPSSEILTHEQVLKVLAAALEKGKESGLDSLEINRLNTLANLARTYDSILEKFERWVEIEERIRRIEQRLVAAEYHEKKGKKMGASE